MAAISPHLRPRGAGAQPTTVAELFFDLVYVFAVTQLSRSLIGDLSWQGAGRTAFLLVVVWWAWIYTTWMVNWFDPGSPIVRMVLLGAMLASLLMASAIPKAFGAYGLLFAGSYIVLQVGRNAAGTLLLGRSDPLRRSFERILVWSLVSAVFWIAGALVHGHARGAVWGIALAIDLAAPVAGYWTPRLGGSTTRDWPVEGAHFAERFQGFIIIALGESIVVTGATASGAGLTTTTVIALSVAFIATGALWWLYFGVVAERALQKMVESDDPGALARDAYTYLHLPIVAGIIVCAVGDELVILHPGHVAGWAEALTLVAGPVLYLLGEAFVRLRMAGSFSTKRLGVVVVLCLLLPLATQITALSTLCIVAAVLVGLALLEVASPRTAVRP